MDNDAILKKIIDSDETFLFGIDAMKLFVLIAHLQVAQRYTNGGSAMIGKELIESFTRLLCREIPEAKELIELGNHPEFDVSEDYFNQEF